MLCDWGGHSQNCFHLFWYKNTGSLLPTVENVYWNLWDNWKASYQGVWPLTKSKLGILGLSFTCLYFNDRGWHMVTSEATMLARPPCPSCLQELCEKIAKKSGQIIWGSLLFILEYCSANMQWILADYPFLLLVEQTHSQCSLKDSPCSGT